MKRPCAYCSLAALLAVVFLLLASPLVVAAGSGLEISYLEEVELSSDQVSIAWNRAPQAMFYFVRIAPLGGDASVYTAEQSPAATQTYTLANLQPNTTYRISVQACSSDSPFDSEVGNEKELDITTSQAENQHAPEKTHLIIHKIFTSQELSSADNLLAGSGRLLTAEEISALDWPEGAIPLEGVQFRLTMVELPPGFDYNAPTFNVQDVGHYTAVLDEDSQIKLQIILTTDSNGLASTTKITSGQPGYNGLSRGYYLVEEIKRHPITETMQPFIIAIPFKDLADNSQGYLQEVHIYPKNAGQQALNQFITSINQQHGTIANNGLGTATWITQLPIPDDINQADADDASIWPCFYLFENQLSPVLALQGSPDQVQVLLLQDNSLPLYDAEGQLIYSKQLQPNQDYLISCTDGLLQIEFIPDENQGFSSLAGYAYLRIVFQTRLEHSLVDLYAHTPISNQARLFYARGSAAGDLVYENSWELAPEHQPELHYGAIDIYKYALVQDADTKEWLPGDNLEGAVFKIAASRDQALNNIFLPELGSSKDLQATTAEHSLPDGQTRAVGRLAYVAYNHNLPYNDTSDTTTSYWLLEVASPQGYQLLNEPLEVEIELEFLLHEQEGSQGLTSNAYFINAEGQPQSRELYRVGSIAIGNQPGWQLPRTGSRGAIILSTAGILLIAAAVVLMRRGKQ